ncbi:MAG: hypothetical protein H6737_16285 [Alphaproteobacteria bacterium]|nr:hypothetical protein [Alphaproteobacteria bacterium]
MFALAVASSIATSGTAPVETVFDPVSVSYPYSTYAQTGAALGIDTDYLPGASDLAHEMRVTVTPSGPWPADAEVVVTPFFSGDEESVHPVGADPVSTVRFQPFDGTECGPYSCRDTVQVEVHTATDDFDFVVDVEIIGDPAMGAEGIETVIGLVDFL